MGTHGFDAAHQKLVKRAPCNTEASETASKRVEFESETCKVQKEANHETATPENQGDVLITLIILKRSIQGRKQMQLLRRSESKKQYTEISLTS